MVEINREQALALIKAGVMQPAGLAEVERAKQDGRWDAADDPPSRATVPDDLLAALLGEAMSRFSEAGDARADLLHCSRVRLPVLLWVLLLSGAAGTVGSMYLFGAEQFWPLAAMTASLAGAVSFMLFLIRDLDNPFQGDWRVTPEPIATAVEQAVALAASA